MKILIYSDKLENYNELCSGAKSVGGEIIAYTLSSADEAGKIPADKVFYTPVNAHKMAEDYLSTLLEIINSEKPEAVFISATKRGKYISARLAAALGTTALTDLNTVSANGSAICGTQIYYGGAGVRTLKSKGATTIVTLGIGTFEPMDGSANSIVEIPLAVSDTKIVLLETRQKSGQTVNLAAAKKVIGVGRGFGEKADLTLAEELATALGAELGCSRPIAEGEGWIDTSRYIGVSGIMLKPDVYIAVGISGQIQHTIGINTAKTIIAINKDKNAPIFKQCDYGIVGDLKQILPELTKLSKG